MEPVQLANIHEMAGAQCILLSSEVQVDRVLHGYTAFDYATQTRVKAKLENSDDCPELTRELVISLEYPN